MEAMLAMCLLLSCSPDATLNKRKLWERSSRMKIRGQSHLLIQGSRQLWRKVGRRPPRNRLGMRRKLQACLGEADTNASGLHTPKIAF